MKADLDLLPGLPAAIESPVPAVSHTLVYRGGDLVVGFGPQVKPGTVLAGVAGAAGGG